jgi:7-cyano-7-deazaguanine reductase
MQRVAAATDLEALELPPIQVVDNLVRERPYRVTFTIPEFTCVCPLTGQPDFATFRITYVPDAHLIELKALKLYIHAYRNVGIFHEFVTNKVLSDLVAACHPRRMDIEADFNVRGGIQTVVSATYERPPAGADGR